MKLSPTGHAVMGAGDSEVSVDNVAVPQAGVSGEAAWITDDRIGFRQNNASDAPVLMQWTVGDAAPARLDDQSATTLRAGGGVWAAFLVGPGVRASTGLVAPASSLCDVSPAGAIVLVPEYQVGCNLRILEPSGVEYWIGTDALGSDASAGPNVRLRGAVLLYQAGGAWHLEALGAGPVAWARRATPINYAVPVLADGRVYLLERENARLTLRPASSTHGWVMATGETLFAPDAVQVRPGTIVVAWATDQGETPGSLVFITQALAAPLVPLDVHRPPIDPPDPVDPIDPIDPVDPIDPIDPEGPPMPPVTLPVRDKYLIADNGMILTVEPAPSPHIDFLHEPQEYGAWQEIEILASHDPRFVLARFCAANKLVRVDVVLWLAQRFHEAIQLYDPAAVDADSGWQQAEAQGHTILFRGPDEDHRIGYTAAFRCVNKDGSDFRVAR